MAQDSRMRQQSIKQKHNASALLDEALATTRVDSNKRKYQNSEIDSCQKHLESAKECGDEKGMNRAYENMGNAYNSIGQYKEAIECSRTQLEIAEKLGNKDKIIVAYGIMAFGYHGKRQYKESIDCCRKQLELIEESGILKNEIGKIHQNIGIAYIDNRQWHEAINPIRKYLEICKNSGSREEIQLAYTIMGIVYILTGQFQKAINCHHIHLQIAEEEKDTIGIRLAYLCMIHAYEGISQFKEAINYCRKTLEIADKLGNRKGIEAAHGINGLLYSTIGQYKEAIDSFKEQLEISTELNDKIGMILAHDGMGFAYSAIGQYEDAISSYRQHEKIAVELKNTKEVITAQKYIKIVEKTVGEIKRAVDSHRKNLEIAQESEDKDLVERAQRANESLGVAYTNAGRYREAIECHCEHLEIAKIMEDKKEMGIAYRGMAVAYKEISRYKKTIKCCRKQLEIAEESGDKKEMEIAYANMTFAYNKTGQYKKAIECCHEHLKIAEKKVQGKVEMERDDEMRKVVHTGFGQYKRAIDCCHAFLEIADEFRAYKIMGIAYSAIGQYKKAIDCYSKHLKVAEELGNNEEMELARTNMIVVQNRIGLSNKAIYTYYKRKKELLQYFGKLYQEHDDHEKANNCYEEAKISKELEDLIFKKEIIASLQDEQVSYYLERKTSPQKKSLLKRNANTAEESTLPGTTSSADSAINSSEKEVNGDDIKPRKNDELYQEHGDHKKANNCYEEAKIIKELEDLIFEMGIIASLQDEQVSYYLERKTSPPKKSLLKRNANTAEESTLPGPHLPYYKKKKELLQYFGKLYQEHDDHEKANNCYEEARIHKKLEDLIFKMGIIASLQDEQVSYYLERKTSPQKKSLLKRNANTAEESTLPGTTSSADSAINSSEKEVNGDDIKPRKNDAQAINVEQPGTNAQLDNAGQNNSTSRRPRRGRTTTRLISPKLRERLQRIQYVKGYGVFDKKLIIHVLEDHEKEAVQYIEEALKEHPFPGGWYIKIFRKTDHVESYLNGVGGYSLYRHCNLLLNNGNINGTIGCFIQFQEPEEHGDRSLDSQIYAVTCYHVAEPNKHDSLVSYKTAVDDESDKLKEFSKEVGLHMLDPTVPVDIALLPVKESCDAFNFEHDECKVYDGEISELEEKKLKVQKQGAVTGSTEGEIISSEYDCEIRGRWYEKTIVLASCSPNEEVSQPGDSGSIVTLRRNAGEKTQEAVAMVFAGGVMDFREGEKVTFAFHFQEAINVLLEENNIDKDYVIVSKLGSKALDKCEENSNTLRSAPTEASPNRSGNVEENNPCGTTDLPDSVISGLKGAA